MDLRHEMFITISSRPVPYETFRRNARSLHLNQITPVDCRTSVSNFNNCDMPRTVA